MTKLFLNSAPGPPDPATAPSPGICSNPTAAYGNLGLAMFNSLIDITGLGTLLDQQTPLDKLKDQISKIKEETQDTINEGAAAAFKLEGSTDELIIRDITTLNQSLQAFVGWQDEIINGKIKLNTIYIGGSFILILIVIFFLFISNAFKK
jgi:hypothetical protein